MQLRVMTPRRLVLEQEVAAVVAEGPRGSFGLLPRHIDLATALVPGVLAYLDLKKRESFVALDLGLLVKCGPEVLVSVRRAVPGDDLESLRRRVSEEFRVLDERERAARSALARLEAGVIRQFLDLSRTHAA